MKKILIVGATSAIAEQCARVWAQQGHALCVVGRSAAPLNAIASDLKTRGASFSQALTLDVRSLDAHAGMVEQAVQVLGGLDIALIAHGTLTDQDRAQTDPAYALDEICTNGTSVISLMSVVGERLATQGTGCVAVISSVAGDRGRESNYVYGSAKALVTAFASGLRQRLSKRGVQVLTIKPGFVDTPMTAHLPKGALWAQPEQVALEIIQAIEKKKHVIYTPGFWRLIMLIIRHIPEAVFVRLKL
jgi:decaprenylphospho-beta-D-erythro-pentofuranosid-2-ulose 2-reductase